MCGLWESSRSLATADKHDVMGALLRGRPLRVDIWGGGRGGLGALCNIHLM